MEVVGNRESQAAAWTQLPHGSITAARPNNSVDLGVYQEWMGVDSGRATGGLMAAFTSVSPCCFTKRSLFPSKRQEQQATCFSKA